MPQTNRWMSEPLLHDVTSWRFKQFISQPRPEYQPQVKGTFNEQHV